ncbi:hypothetical protein EAG_11309 [Camponotus floridanus]|uniref:Uncharacterized protein n=1 Tax=Camponotus floridanus TaxID=104421 RepID=E2A0W4_CAMFO|nr:hypothetical protein EAG_11309 [Camponotus floridanus]
MMDVEETNTASTASSSPRPSSPVADSTFISVKREPSTDEPSSPLEATSPGSILRNNNGESLKIIINNVYQMFEIIIIYFIQKNK